MQVVAVVGGVMEDRDLVAWLIERHVVTADQVEECRRACPRPDDAACMLDALVARGYLDPVELSALGSLFPAAAPATPGRDLLPNVPTVQMDSATPPVAAPGVARAQTGPRTVGPFQVLEELGRGGMGVVYRAFDPRLSRIIALKLLERTDGTGALARFHREAQLAARLKHPRIVQIHEVGESEGRPYIAMEFVPGDTLRRHLLKHPGDFREAARLLEQVAEALAYAHEQGVVHRDIKPENILLDEAGRAEVSDFGLAKDMGEATRMTLSGAVLGTPSYMAPEQAEGRASMIGPATDIYGVGAVLYEALTGRPPYEGAGVMDILNQIMHEDPVPPSLVNPQVPHDLELISLKCMERDPDRRYPSAAALAEDLGRYLAGEAVCARPASTIYRLRRWMTKRRVALALNALVLAVCVAGVWIAVQSVRNAREVANALGAARAAETAENLEQARDGYREVLALARGNGEAGRGIERVEARLGELAGARAQAEKEAMQLLESGRPALDEARRYLYQKDANYEQLQQRVEVGKKLIEQAVARAPQIALGHYLLGRAWRLLGWDDKAEACWDEAIRLDEKFGSAHFQLGMLYLERAILTRVLLSSDASDQDRVDRSAALFHQAQGELDAASDLSWTGEDELSRDLLRVAQAFVAGREDEVLQRSVEAVTRFGGGEGCEGFLVLRAYVSQADDETRATYEQALRICPHEWLALFGLGSFQYDHGEFDEAVKNYDRAIAVRPRFLPAYCNRAAARRSMGDHDGAITDCNQALSMDPQYVMALLERSNAREALGDLSRAIADLDRALAIRPRWVPGLVNRADCRWKEGDLDGAILDCSIALSINPREDRAFLFRGLARDRRGDWDEAIADFDEALAINARRPETWIARGTARGKKGDLDGAIADFDQALAINSRLPEAFSNRGNARAGMGDRAGALADYAQAVAVAPKDWPHRKALESVLERERGARNERATAPWRAAIARGDKAIRDGDYAAARSAYEEALVEPGTEAEKDPASRAALLNAHYNLACAYSLLSAGRSSPTAAPQPVDPAKAREFADRAFAHLRKSLELGFSDLPHLDADPDLAPIRGDARWEDLCPPGAK